MAKAPTEIRSLARLHTERAISVLCGIMDEPQSGAPARVAAANALLDRGWGKPPQTISGDEDNPLVIQQIIRKIIEPSTSGRLADIGSVVGWNAEHQIIEPEAK